eukprot:12407094-Karenia_brevis.AAC.1
MPSAASGISSVLSTSSCLPYNFQHRFDAVCHFSKQSHASCHHAFERPQLNCSLDLGTHQISARLPSDWKLPLALLQDLWTVKLSHPGHGHA